MKQGVTAPKIYDWTERVPQPIDPALDRLVKDIIGKVADKWTMLVLEALSDHGTLRFGDVGRKVGDISQKMLTKTLRQMEADGLVQRVVHPVIPPHVDYSLTEMGGSLGAAFCGVWLWAEAHHSQIEASRKAFAARNEPDQCGAGGAINSQTLPSLSSK